MINTIDYITSFISFIPFILGILFFRFASLDVRVFIIGFMVAAVFDLILFLLAHNRINNLPIVNTYTLVDAFILIYAFSLHFKITKIRLGMLLLALAYSIIWAWDNFIVGDIFSFNAIEKSVKCLLLSGISTYYLFKISKEIKIPIFRNTKFWIGLGYLMYFSITFLLFATSSWFFHESHRSVMHFTWTLHSVFAIMANLVFSYALLCLYRNRNLYSSSP